MSKANKPLGRKDEIVIQEIDGEVLIYDLRSDKAFCLNPTSAAIWKLCDGEKSVGEIAERVAKEFNAANSEDLVWFALDQLKNENLIAGGLDASYDHFDGMSRRQAVRKMGLASMVSIPIIASILAPTARAAASVCVANEDMTCFCPHPPCPGGPFPAPVPGTVTVCAGVAIDCTSGPATPTCQCRGPYVCVTSTFVQGMCS